MDSELVRRGMAESAVRAREVVGEGRVLVSGAPATKPNRLVSASEPIHILSPRPRFVSRGGEKLQSALEAFGVDVDGLRCLDVGASTGGFTDCLLVRGAVEVVAVDVGRGQLAWSLREDPRVTVLERTDVRDLDPRAVGRVDLVTVDVSFISLRTVLPALRPLTQGAIVLALVKPQFEVGRRVPAGGVVRDPALQAEAVAAVVAAAERAGFACEAAVPSAVPGAQGNREFFLLLRGGR